VTEPDEELRGALRDLIPDYTGPVDPVPQIVARVRRRRTRQRTLLAVGGSAVVAVLALLAPAVLLPSGAGGGLPAASPGGSAPAAPAPTDDVGPLPPEPPVYPVATGTVRSVRWAIGSVRISAGARRCLRSGAPIFAADTACFDGWTTGAPVTWASEPVTGGGVTVTWIGGVSPGPAVRIRLTDGTSRTLPAVRTATDPTARFFGVVVEGTVEVRDVTVLNASGRPLGAAVTDPGSPCRPSPSVGCTETVPDGAPAPASTGTPAPGSAGTPGGRPTVAEAGAPVGPGG
jgi:hypothetical protein